MNISNNFSSIQQIQETYLSNQNYVSRNENGENVAFSEILKEKTGSAKKSAESALALKFSKHADSRLSDRNITLSEEQLDRLEEGTKKAATKGINESLVIMDNLSFIVNIKNQTVITAMDNTETNDNVYTNIDGAVII